MSHALQNGAEMTMVGFGTPIWTCGVVLAPKVLPYVDSCGHRGSILRAFDDLFHSILI
jgi:hypothetical protein